MNECDKYTAECNVKPKTSKKTSLYWFTEKKGHIRETGSIIIKVLEINRILITQKPRLTMESLESVYSRCEVVCDHAGPSGGIHLLATLPREPDL